MIRQKADDAHLVEMTLLNVLIVMMKIYQILTKMTTSEPNQCVRSSFCLISNLQLGCWSSSIYVCAALYYLLISVVTLKKTTKFFKRKNLMSKMTLVLRSSKSENGTEVKLHCPVSIQYITIHSASIKIFIWH